MRTVYRIGLIEVMIIAPNCPLSASIKCAWTFAPPTKWLCVWGVAIVFGPGSQLRVKWAPPELIKAYP